MNCFYLCLKKTFNVLVHSADVSLKQQHPYPDLALPFALPIDIYRSTCTSLRLQRICRCCLSPFFRGESYTDDHHGDQLWVHVRREPCPHVPIPNFIDHFCISRRSLFDDGGTRPAAQASQLKGRDVLAVQLARRLRLVSFLSSAL